MNQRERVLQIAIRDGLALFTDHFRNAVVIDCNPVPLRDKRGKVCGIKHTHADKGTGDILVQAPGGRAFWLEVKDEGKRQQKNQKTFESKWKSGGGGYYVVRSVRDALVACLEFAGKHGIVDHRLEGALEQWAA